MQPPIHPPHPTPPHPVPAATCACTGEAPSQRVLSQYSADLYSRPCKLLSYVGARNGTQAQCEAFTFTGRRQLSDCMGEAANYDFTM